MNTFELVISGLAALALFAYGLQSLSRQIERNWRWTSKASFVTCDRIACARLSPRNLWRSDSPRWDRL